MNIKDIWEKELEEYTKYDDVNVTYVYSCEYKGQKYDTADVVPLKHCPMAQRLAIGGALYLADNGELFIKWGV